MRPFHTEIAGESLVLAISSDCVPSRYEPRPCAGRVPPTTPLRVFRVGLRSHWIGRRQDHTSSAEGAPRDSRASKPSRSKPEAGKSNVNPRWRAIPGAFPKISAPRIAISRAIRKRRRLGVKWVVRPCSPLTQARPGCELQSPEASWPAPSRSERRCGRYPPLQVPIHESGSAWPLEPMPEVFQPVEQRMALLAVICQTFPENEPCVRAVPRPAPDAAPLFPSSLRARALRAAHGCVGPLLGSPCAPRS